MSVTYIWECKYFNKGKYAMRNIYGTYKAAVADSIRYPLLKEETVEIALLRDTDQMRSWACITLGGLPTHFVDLSGAIATKVPMRFHDEVIRFQTDANDDDMHERDESDDLTDLDHDDNDDYEADEEEDK